MAAVAVLLPCHGQRSLPALVPLLAMLDLRLHGASFSLQVLQHFAAAAGLHGQLRVSCQLPAGRWPFAPGRRRCACCPWFLCLLLTGWLLV